MRGEQGVLASRVAAEDKRLTASRRGREISPIRGRWIRVRRPKIAISCGLRYFFGRDFCVVACESNVLRIGRADAPSRDKGRVYPWSRSATDDSKGASSPWHLAPDAGFNIFSISSISGCFKHFDLSDARNSFRQRQGFRTDQSRRMGQRCNVIRTHPDCGGRG